jgi:PiT family inorganic phosphate transporter
MNILLAAADLANQAMAKSVEPADAVTTGAMVLLFLAVGLALAFEFVNGFHDTANAVATVIYTHSLKPWVAVVWSGLCNLCGVLLSPAGVAFTIVALLPAEMVINVGSAAGFAMVFALLLSAIIWNLGTWYLGLPASSSHTLIGAIMGVGLCNSMMSGGHSFGEGVNWDEVRKVFLTLLVSPIFGFVGAGALLLLSKQLLRWPALYAAPPKDAPPPIGVRALLIGTCTGVSFFHGSNDGQKGMGLMLLILIGILPGVYALKLDTSADKIRDLQTRSALVASTFEPGKSSMEPKTATDELEKYLKGKGEFDARTLPALGEINHQISTAVAGHQSLGELPLEARKTLRNNLYLTGATITKLDKEKKAPAQQKMLDQYKSDRIDPFTQFIPPWVKVATALALGVGTMIGWKRIVVTVGEKIGKEHLTYAQGASAELMAMATIFAADKLKLPVSTTHVLSSGVAGTMAANKSGLQMATLRNLLLAWVLTLPVCILLGAGLFAAGLLVVLHNLVPLAIGIMLLAVAIGIGWRVKSTGKRTPDMVATAAT